MLAFSLPQKEKTTVLKDTIEHHPKISLCATSTYNSSCILYSGCMSRFQMALQSSKFILIVLTHD